MTTPTTEHGDGFSVADNSTMILIRLVHDPTLRGKLPRAHDLEKTTVNENQLRDER
jgi:hypothetical protein